MAGVHTYSQLGRKTTVFAIDHSVGHGGRNLKDDVQLIQVLINRYINEKEDAHKRSPEPRYDARVLDKAGHTIDKLVVDGICGTLTLAAILATQKSLSKWKGCAIDGRIDAIEEGGASQYAAMEEVLVRLPTGKVIREFEPTTHFNTMYVLAVTTGARPINPDWDRFSLPEPLRTSLARSMSRFFGGWGGHQPKARP